MNATNAIALKEWAVVCAALAAGRQTVLLRTGGIAEGPDGFQVEHPEFWLLPTRFHQSADELADDAASLLETAKQWQFPAGLLRLGLYARVEDVQRITDVTLLSCLDGQHILSAETIRSRFAYRDPGLFVMTVRVFRRTSPFEVFDAPEYAGCHSWVQLTASLSTEDLQPVIPADQFSEWAEQIRLLLQGDGSADHA